MSSEDFDKTKKFWNEVGLVIIHVSDGGVIIGRIIETAQSMLTVKDLNGSRHWINNDSVVRIEEIGTGEIK